MTSRTFAIAPEKPEDDAAIEQLHEEAFGPGRFTRTAYRLRDNAGPFTALNFTGWTDGELAGSVRYSRVRLGESVGLLLGPLVVNPLYKDMGCGLALMRHTLELARRAGFAWVVLVGDAPYYARAGFAPVPRGRITLPGPVDPDRLLYLELVPGALDGLSGQLAGTREVA